MRNVNMCQWLSFTRFAVRCKEEGEAREDAKMQTQTQLGM